MGAIPLTDSEMSGYRRRELEYSSAQKSVVRF